MKKLMITVFLLIASSLAGCHTLQTNDSPMALNNSGPTPSINDPGLWQKTSSTTWHTLQHTPLPTLEKAYAQENEPTAKGWLALGIIAKRSSTSTPTLVRELENWRATYPSHPGNQLFPADATLNELTGAAKPQHLAILLPLHGPAAGSGQTVKNGFLSAYYDGLSQSGQKQAISFYDTNETTDIGALYQKAASEGADMIVGPLTKTEVDNLHKLGHYDVRVLALNYSPASFFNSTPANFYQFGLSPEEETQQLADKAVQANLKRALIISANDDWGHRVVEALSTRYKAGNGSVTDTLYFSPSTDLSKEIAGLLHINPEEDRELSREGNNKSVLAEQRRHDFDVIFIFAQPDMARQIVPLLKFYYAGNVPLYSISSIYAGQPNPSRDKDLNGVTFCETPWLIRMANTPGGKPDQYKRLYAVGRDAYLLSQSMPRLNSLPNFPIYGATGALDMDKQQIHQRLPWVTMHNGRI